MSFILYILFIYAAPPKRSSQNPEAKMCVKHGKYHCSCTKHRFFVGGAPMYVYIYTYNFCRWFCAVCQVDRNRLEFCNQTFSFLGQIFGGWKWTWQVRNIVGRRNLGFFDSEATRNRSCIFFLWELTPKPGNKRPQHKR